ncbi:MAG: T9SS type A sorting domain-containing protein [Flavobacteriales bacterium]|nr:MAG: T9SS type A sorting domain-containing protein [Flavobacteriales bacterium]
MPYRIILLFFLLMNFVSIGQIEDLSFGTNDTFDIMTWNIEQFPKNGQTTVNYVSEIIQNLEMDIIAIQEVDNINYFEQMVDGLNMYEGYLESEWFAGLAYIYNPEVIQINDLYEIYTTSDYWSAFPRSPMVMDLNYNDHRIIVINNHYKCCGDGILNMSDSGDEETRRYQANLLLKTYIDQNFSSENVILLGDLNDDIAETSQNNVFQMFIEDSQNYLFADIEIATGTSANWSFPNWPSHLDHLLITNELFSEFENENSEVKTIKIDDYLSGWSEYDQNISDHRPVALKLNMDSSLSITNISDDNAIFWNTPNPFKDQTVFKLNDLSENQRIEIYTALGQKITTLYKIGVNTITWNSENFTNGIYIAKLIINNQQVSSKKLVLIK